MYQPAAADSIDSRIEIITPENISFQYEVAGPFRRIPAFLLDAITCVVLQIATVLGFWLLCLVIGIHLIALTPAVLLIAIFFLYWFYGACCEYYWNGQTVGKRASGLRVLSENGRPLTASQAFLRNFLRAADMLPMLPLVLPTMDPELTPPFPFPLFALGLAATMCNRRFQRLGDLAAGTMVVVEEQGSSDALYRVDDAKVREVAGMFPAGLRLSSRQARAVSAYVGRRMRMSPARREEVASRLADPLRERFHLPKEITADRILVAVYHLNFVQATGDQVAEGVPVVRDLPFQVAGRKASERIAAGAQTASVGPSEVDRGWVQRPFASRGKREDSSQPE